MSTRNYSSNYNKYRRTSNYPYRRGTTGYKSNTISKRANNNIKAAFEQRDQAEVVLNCNNILSCQLQTAESNGNWAVGALNVFDALIHSEFFGNYAPMYDQVRIDKVKAKFTSLQYPQQSRDNSNFNFSIVTAFDRNGLDEGQILSARPAFNGVDIAYGTSIGKNIATYSSALTKNLTFGNAFDIVRYISPSSMQEKSQFIATDSLKQWYQKYDYVNNQYNAGPSAEGTPGQNAFTKNAVAKNPCYLEKCEAIPFKPTYLIGVIGLSALEGNVVFNVELDVCCTFRGLRKSLTM